MFNLEGRLYNNFKLAPDDYRNGRFENIDVDLNGDAVKIYSDLINNSLSIGIQPSGTDHGDYKDLGIINLGDLY